MSVSSVKFEKVRQRRIYQEVLEQITQLMIEGKLNPGDKLMGEREMAGALGVSRTTLRDALRTLEVLGVVEIKPGEGTFIKDNQTDEVVVPLALALSVEQNCPAELWETRMSLEVECAGLAAQRAGEANIRLIYEALGELRNSLTNLDFYTKADMHFHYTIAQSAQNSILTRLLQTFAVHIRELITKASKRGFTRDRQGIRAYEEHLGIYEAVRSGDAERARLLMREHLQWAMAEYNIIVRP